MNFILFLLRISPGIVILTVLTSLAAGFCNAGVLAVISSELGDSSSNSSDRPFKFIILCVAMVASRIASEVMLVRASQNANLKLRMRLCRQALAVQLRHLEEIGPPRILSALTDDVSIISGAITALPLLCLHAAIILGCLVYLTWLSWGVFLGVLGIMFIAVISYHLFGTKASRHVRRSQEERDKLFHHFRKLTDGIKELKLHSRRRDVFVTGVIQTTAESMRRSLITASTILTLTTSWGYLLTFALIGLILFVMPGFQSMDKQILTSYIMAIIYMVTPIESLLNRLGTLKQASVALNRVEQLGFLLSAHQTEEPSLNQPDPQTAWQEIELRGATHTYHRESENSNFTLGPIDLRLMPGELVFLTGGNGSGKTTMAKLLVGLYAPESGEIRLNGKAVTDETREAYRQHFSVVFSDFCLFDSLIGLDVPGLDEKAREYLVQFHLDHKVQIADGSLSTTALSQGQRKRLALLTAYLEDRPIYVFDEWAADQDPFFKDVFYNRLLVDLKNRGKTIVVISHDEQYYYRGERIIKLSQGELVYDSLPNQAEFTPAD